MSSEAVAHGGDEHPSAAAKGINASNWASWVTALAGGALCLYLTEAVLAPWLVSVVGVSTYVGELAAACAVFFSMLAALSLWRRFRQRR